jgi:HNH endonuclease
MMTDCIEAAKRFSQGYGRVGNRTAHRVAWEQKHGPIPSGMVVMHLCNNRACINLDHLRLGTQSENIKQAVRERRGFIGSLNNKAKLTETDVRAIRSSPESCRALAPQYGVSETTISHVRCRITWASVD